MNTNKKKTLSQRIDSMIGPRQTQGLAKSKAFVQSSTVTKLLAQQIEKIAA